MSPPARIGLGPLSVLLAVLCLGFALAAGSLLSSPASFEKAKAAMIPELRGYLEKIGNADDTARQRAAHRFLLLSGTAGACLVGLALRHGKGMSQPGLGSALGSVRFAARRAGLLSLIVAVAYVACFPRSAFSKEHLVGLALAGGAFIFLAFLFRFRIERDRFFGAACLGAAALLLLAALVPGLRGTFSFAGKESLVSVTGEHYGIVFLNDSDRLLLSRDILPDLSLCYGVLFPSLVAGAARATGHVLSLGGAARLLQSFQFLFAGLFFILYVRWHARAPLAVLAAVALMLQWVTNNGFWLFYPNHSGVRYLAFPIVLTACFAARNLPWRRAALLLGAACGGAVLWNFETGLVASLGALAFLWLRHGDPFAPGNAGAFTGMTARFALAWILAAVLCVAGAVLLTGHRGLWREVAGMPSLFARFAGGFGGIGWKLYPVPTLILLWALVVTLRGGIAWALHGPRGFRAAFRTMVAALILLWGAYYVSRPDKWNGWMLTLLFGFLVGDALPPALWRWTLRRGRLWHLPIPILAFCLVLVPNAAVGLGRTAHAVLQGTGFAHGPLREGEVQAFGAVLPREAAESLRSRIAVLEALWTEGRTVAYFSQDASCLEHFSRVPTGLIYTDPLIDATTTANLGRMLGALRASAPEVILFDIPVDPIANEAEAPQNAPGDLYTRYFTRLRAALATDYAEAGTYGGWIVLHRR